MLSNLVALSFGLSTEQGNSVVAIQDPESLKQIVELASVPIELFVIEPACNLAPIPLGIGGQGLWLQRMF